MRELFPTLVGNEKIKEILATQIAQGTFSHAYTIEGAPGTGKYETAKLAAAAILCEHRSDDGVRLPCGHCLSCRKVLSGIAPDVTVLEAVKVAETRELRAKLYESPTESEYKIYILKDAQNLTAQAQNSLLISLEEPPKNVVFFLLCTDAGALLETIRSRAPVLRTRPLSAGEARAYLVANSDEAKALSRSDPAKLDALILSAGGSLGKTLSLIGGKEGDETLGMRKEALDLLDDVLRADADSYVHMGRFAAKDRETLRALLSEAMTALRDVIVTKRTSGGELLFFPNTEDAIEKGDAYTLSRLDRTYEALFTAYTDLSRNAATYTTLYYLLLQAKGKETK